MKNLLPYLPVIILAFTLIGGWFNLQADTKTTKAKVEELKADVKEVTIEAGKEIKDLKDKDQKLENAVIVGQVKQEEIQKKVEDTNQKVDKVIDLLLEMKQKKK